MNHLPARPCALLMLLSVFAAPLSQASTAEEQGAAMLLPFKQQLMGALKAGLEQGPDAAIDICRIEAPMIASNLSMGGVAMGRTSHRLRNPDNAGPEWATAVLEQYLEAGAELAPQTVALDDGQTGYVEPIVTQPMCLACHGAELSPAVQAALDTHYPRDQATGFKVGDLRGIFWVSYPTEP